MATPARGGTVRRMPLCGRRGVAILAGLAGAAAAPLSAAQGPSTCVVSRAAVMTQSEQALAMGAQFQGRRQELQSAYQASLSAIDSDARMLASLRSSLPPAVAKARDDEIGNRRSALERDAGRANQQLAGLNDTLTRQLMERAQPIIREVGAARGCAVVLPSDGLFAVLDNRIDLTAAVLARLRAAPPAATTSR